VKEAAGLPLAWKNAGMFESRLIAALYPRLASYPSAYNFLMSDGPARIARVRETMTCLRPAWIRPAISALNRRLHNRREATTLLLKRYRSLLAGEWRLDEWLDKARLDDPAALSRLLAVEIVSRKLSP
jgi:asparagine synthase (glutamine-hydrolysing)